MASIDNEFVVRLFCVCLGTKMMLVSEFVPFGALNDHLKKFKTDFNAKTLLTFATQIASVWSQTCNSFSLHVMLFHIRV